ncbi:hypothetical protein ABZU76_47210 [Amycolatopsis sp. NPDC005232]|uniref:hypothetical protein n=1 Tax=Amycolatopsis sp. NPDC005232 TaxID=3157027 RepID=UPI0033B20D1D
MSRKGVPRAKARPGSDRTPRAVSIGAVQQEKKPRREFTPSEPDSKLVILFSRVDVGGPWCLTEISQSDHAGLLGRIRDIESMTVHSVFSGNGLGKDYPLPLPNDQANGRLSELEYDDRDEINCLRITGERRLYGFREGPRFYALWWDPHHKIWPSRKKHT